MVHLFKYGNPRLSRIIETTGLDEVRDAIIEIAAVRFNGKRKEDEFNTLINPGKHSPDFITGLTGIDDAMVRQAPRLRDVMQGLTAFVGDAPIIGHNVKFDVGFLRKAGLFEYQQTIDTLELASVLLPTASRYNLGALGNQLGIPLPATHRALDDALVTHACYLRLLEIASELPLETLEEIADLGNFVNWDSGWVFEQALKAKMKEGIKPKQTKSRASHPKTIFDWGYPVILKPLAGFGSLRTFRCGTAGELDDALRQLKPSAGKPVAIEEFIEGHEGFFDSMCDSDGVRHEFAAHYYPGCLEATQQRWISPQIAVTNRIGERGYDELRAMNARVIAALGIRNAATHMEWFFGPKGLKFREIGARPAGEKIWDMYRVANEFDVYREWALAILGRPGEQQPSRRYAAGSIQIRPDRDGRIVGHRGLEAALQRCGEFIYEQSVPAPGTPTKALDKGCTDL